MGPGPSVVPASHLQASAPWHSGDNWWHALCANTAPRSTPASHARQPATPRGRALPDAGAAGLVRQAQEVVAVELLWGRQGAQLRFEGLQLSVGCGRATASANAEER